MSEHIWLLVDLNFSKRQKIEKLCILRDPKK